MNNDEAFGIGTILRYLKKKTKLTPFCRINPDFKRMNYNYLYIGKRDISPRVIEWLFKDSCIWEEMFLTMEKTNVRDHETWIWISNLRMCFILQSTNI